MRNLLLSDALNTLISTNVNPFACMSALVPLSVIVDAYLRVSQSRGCRVGSKVTHDLLQTESCM